MLTLVPQMIRACKRAIDPQLQTMTPILHCQLSDLSPTRRVFECYMQVRFFILPFGRRAIDPQLQTMTPILHWQPSDLSPTRRVFECYMPVRFSYCPLDDGLLTCSCRR